MLSLRLAFLAGFRAVCDWILRARAKVLSTYAFPAWKGSRRIHWAPQPDAPPAHAGMGIFGGEQPRPRSDSLAVVAIYTHLQLRAERPSLPHTAVTRTPAPARTLNSPTQGFDFRVGLLTIMAIFARASTIHPHKRMNIRKRRRASPGSAYFRRAFRRDAISTGQYGYCSHI